MHGAHACHVYTWEPEDQKFKVFQNFPQGAGLRGLSGVANVVSLVLVVSPGQGWRGMVTGGMAQGCWGRCKEGAGPCADLGPCSVLAVEPRGTLTCLVRL